DLDSVPTPLLVESVSQLTPGKALDLACGTGRNAVWLAEHDWSVTAVDGSPAAIDILRRRVPTFDARVADLERGEYRIEPANWDLILMCYYLQRDLITPAKLGVKPGGLLLSMVHIAKPGEQPTYKRAAPGELKTYFSDWEILHDREEYPVAEIVARRPHSP